MSANRGTVERMATRDAAATNEAVLDKLAELYRGLYEHDGFGEIRIEMRILRRGQKEVILHCGKQYRFVVDCPASERPSGWGAGQSSASGGQGADRRAKS